MVVNIPVNNQCIRVISETKDGWRCELFTKKNGEFIPVADKIFWNFNIPNDWLKENHILKLHEFMSEEQILYVLQEYIDHIDSLRHYCRNPKANLYKDGKFISSECDHPKNVICRHVLENKNLYPNSHAGYRERNNVYWLVGVEMNIKGIYFYGDLEARPIVNGKEIRV